MKCRSCHRPVLSFCKKHNYEYCYIIIDGVVWFYGYNVCEICMRDYKYFDYIKKECLKCTFKNSIKLGKTLGLLSICRFCSNRQVRPTYRFEIEVKIKFSCRKCQGFINYAFKKFPEVLVFIILAY